MRGIHLFSCWMILSALILVPGMVSGLRSVPTPTIDTADIEAYHSIDNASLAIYAGQNALQNGRYEEALEHYTLATESDPSWQAAWYLKSFSLKKLNRTEEALTAVNKALSLDDSDRDSNNLKADILERLGRTNEAEQYRSRVASSPVVSDPPVSPASTPQSPLRMLTMFFGLGGSA